jgi:acyl-CoA hydrolase
VNGKSGVIGKLVGKPVKDSQSEMTELVLPNDTNPLGALLGGRLMHMVDIAAALAGHRHSRSYIVTAAVDHLDFLHPARMGQFVVLKSSVNRVWNTSMEIGVKAFAEDILSGKRLHICSAYLTFVALDEHGNRRAIPPVIPEGPEEVRRYEQAGERRMHRLELRRESPKV